MASERASECEKEDGMAMLPQLPTPDSDDAGRTIGFVPDMPPTVPAAAADVEVPRFSPTTAIPVRAGRYLLEDALGRGGMGLVCRALDTELNRHLAVKLLLEEHRGQAEMERRFREEAQLTGQLQHPGVPPVHEVGCLEDGRPFFAMKLIKGRTLAELLAERPGGAGGAPLVDDLPRFLAIFLQVCQTVAYAHSQGVIHRDLKPGNIMVGAFGEVQVMDWGLAKLLPNAEPLPFSRDAKSSGRTDCHSVPPTDALRCEDSALQLNDARDPTLAGSIVGTLAYMAPEQASGEIDQIDERTDVFGLGAVLCVILTGKPPYTGHDAAVYRKARQGDLSEAINRLAACGADADLIALAERCLAADRNTRPHNAGMVAQTVTEYLAGVQERLRQAEVEKAAAQEVARRALNAPYLDVGSLRMIWKRGIWLALLFLGEMLAATAMGSFEKEIEKAVVLAMLVPLIISSGGNSGSQASTLVIRSLALTELHLGDWWRVLLRELRTGLPLGFFLGLLGFLRIQLWQHLGFADYGEHHLLIAFTVWASLIGVIAFATLAGSMMPFFLQRLGFDPATSSGPSLATLVDVAGLVIYFTVALLILRGRLL
jgi:serine/threonine protein kinase/cation transporter-like permease